MVLDKLKQHVISRLRLFIIPIYLLIDIVFWNAFMFIIYRDLPPIYGIKIVLAVVSFIFLFKYSRRWRANLEVKFASKTIFVFFILSLAGSILELIIYSVVNESFLYTILIALFAATINAYSICFSFKLLQS